MKGRSLRRFGSAAPAEADVRPTLLGVVTLMFLLLFFLLSTSTGQRLSSIGLRLLSPEDVAPLPHSGLLKRLEIQLVGARLTLLADIATTDIAAAATSTETRRIELPAIGDRPDLAGLQRTLLELHSIDPAQERATFAPDDTAPMDTVFAVLDVVRGPDSAPLFPQVALTGGQE